MSDIIEQAIMEASTASTPPLEAKEVVKEESIEDKSEGDSEDAPLPKKAINAIQKRDKKIAKLNYEYKQAMKELEALKQPKVEEKKEALSTDSFATLEDYMEALVDTKVKKGEKETPKEEFSPEQVAYYNSRQEIVAKERGELALKLPDFEDLITNNMGVIGAFSEDIEGVILDSETPVLALYTLAKEDRLFDLTEMTVAQAARAIAQAEIRGQKYLKPAITNAPAPIGGGRGKSTNISKPLNDKSPDELLDWLRN